MLMGSVFAALLLATTLVAHPSALILKSGDRIDVTGDLRVNGQSVVFTSNGRLFSLPLSEIDVDATNYSSTAPIVVTPASRPSEPPAGPRMRYSKEERDRILRELENRKMDPKELAEAKRISAARASSTPLMSTVDVSAPVDREAQKREERDWRQQSHFYEEQVRQRREDLELLKSRIQRLEDEVLSLLSLGYKPEQFSYQVLQLQRNREQLDAAELEVRRAERALDQFLEDARREGVPPGVLR